MWTTANLPKLATPELTEADLHSASRLALSINVARHLVNIPGGQLNPKTYAECIENLFAGSESSTVEVWERDRLVRQRRLELHTVRLERLAAGTAVDLQPGSIAQPGR